MAGRHRASRKAPTQAAVGFRDVLQVREFTALLIAYVLSTAGDQVARLGLAVVVFDRTGSAALTAVTYAVTYLPWLVAGPLLSGLGDRYPRRRILIVTDLARAGLAATLALPDLPLPVLLALVFLLVCGEPPFDSARAAMLPEVLAGDAYVVGHSLQSAMMPAASFLGLLGGGLVIAQVGAAPALLANAGTFVLSALVALLFVRSRPAAGAQGSTAGDLAAGLRVVLTNPHALWVLVFAATVMAFDAVGFALAVPWADQLGRGSGAAGVISAAGPIGAALGGLVLARAFPPATRVRLLPWLGVLTVAPQTAFLLGLPLPGVVALLAFAGLGGGCQVVANQVFVLSVPPEHRSKAFGVAGAVLMAGQGLAIVGSGVLAQTFAPSTVVGLTSLVGTGVVLGLLTRRPDLTGLLAARVGPAASAPLETLPAAVPVHEGSEPAPWLGDELDELVHRRVIRLTEPADLAEPAEPVAHA